MYVFTPIEKCPRLYNNAPFYVYGVDMEPFFPCLDSRSVRVATPEKQNYKITLSANKVLIRLRTDFERKDIAVRGTSTFSIDKPTGLVQWEFSCFENLDESGIKTALFNCLRREITQDGFNGIVSVEHHANGTGRCFIPVLLLSAMGHDTLQESRCASTQSEESSHSTGYTPNRLLAKLPSFRTPEVTSSEKSHTQRDHVSEIEKLAGIFRQLILLSRDNPDSSYIFVKCLNKNPGLWTRTLSILNAKKGELWEGPVTQLLSLKTEYDKGVFLIDYLDKNPVLRDDLFIVLLNTLSADKDLLKELVAPLRGTKTELWVELSGVFGITEKESKKNYSALCSYLEGLTTGEALSAEFKENSEELSQLLNQLDSYYSDVIPVLYQYFLTCGEIERPGFVTAVKLFSGILGENYQIALSPNSTPNAKTSTFNLLITPPPDARESIVVLLIQKLHSLLGADNFQNLISFEPYSDGTCSLTLPANPLEGFQQKLYSLAELSFSEVREMHIEALMGRTCFGVLDAALERLQKKNPASLNDEKARVFIKNFRKLVQVFFQFNEALVTDIDFRELLSEKFGHQFNSAYVQRDVPRRMDSFFIYLNSRPDDRNLVDQTFNSLVPNNDKVGKVPLVLIYECLNESTNLKDANLSNCFGILMNVWINFGSYYESEILGATLEIADQNNGVLENDVSSPSKIALPITSDLPTLQKTMTEVITDSPVVRIIRKDGRDIFQSPAFLKSSAVRKTIVYKKTPFDTPYQGPANLANSRQRAKMHSTLVQSADKNHPGKITLKPVPLRLGGTEQRGLNLDDDSSEEES